MRHHRGIITLSAIICLLLTGITLAEVPSTISYQGRATDSSGNPVPDSSYFARFYLYTARTGGTLVWLELDLEHPSVTTKDGYFTHLLGSLNPIPDSVFSKYDSLFLQVMFNFQTLSPRTPLVSTGYSFRVNSVDRYDIIDEPGIAQSVVDSSINVNIQSTFMDLTTVSITIPHSGYIMLFGKAVFTFNSSNRYYVQIDQTSGGSFMDSDVSAVVIDSPIESTLYGTINCHRVYYKMFTGTYTFRLEAALNGSGQVCSAGKIVLTAMYIPTSYGPVETMLSTEDSREFGDITPLGMGANGNVKIDLRQLELRAAKAEAAAEKAKRELLEEQIKQSGQGTR